MKLSTIKPGYMLRVTSWENDGDNYNTETLEGLTANQALFYMDFLPQFRSGSNNGKATYGNSCDDSEVNWGALIADTIEAANKHNIDLKEMLGVDTLEYDEDDEDSFDDIKDAIGSLVYDLLGGSEFYVFRVFESYECFYVPSAIKAVAYNELVKEAAK